MLDVAWSEIVLIGVVALVAIGPKDLPKAMLALGKVARYVRQFGHDIRQQIDQLAYEAEVAAKQADKQDKPPPPKQDDKTDV